MTVEEASKLNCPYKPYKTTLDGEPVPTCNPVGCMCWISIVKKHYVSNMYVQEGESFDKESYPMHERYGASDRIYGIPTTTVEQSYCSLRGKDI